MAPKIEQKTDDDSSGLLILEHQDLSVPESIFLEADSADLVEHLIANERIDNCKNINAFYVRPGLAPRVQVT